MWRQPKNEDNIEHNDKLKREDDPKSEEDQRMKTS